MAGPTIFEQRSEIRVHLGRVYYYRQRMRRRNKFGRVCLSVCLPFNSDICYQLQNI